MGAQAKQQFQYGSFLLCQWGEVFKERICSFWSKPLREGISVVQGSKQGNYKVCFPFMKAEKHTVAPLESVPIYRTNSMYWDR